MFEASCEFRHVQNKVSLENLAVHFWTCLSLSRGKPESRYFNELFHCQPRQIFQGKNDFLAQSVEVFKQMQHLSSLPYASSLFFCSHLP